MRKLLCFIFLITLSFSIRAQAPVDTTTASYLKNRYYIQLSDSTHLPKSVQPYHYNLQNFMVGDKAYLRNCYIPAGGVRDDSYTITISLLDIQSVRIKKAYEEDRSNISSTGGDGSIKVIIVKPKPPLGNNLSGRDGYLIINKLSGKIDFELYPKKSAKTFIKRKREPHLSN